MRGRGGRLLEEMLWGKESVETIPISSNPTLPHAWMEI